MARSARTQKVASIPSNGVSSPNKIKVVRVDILKSHSSQVKENFDTNFLLTLKNNSGANFQTLLDQFNAKKYDDLEIDIYGAALKNGIWKGKRIIGKL